MLDSIKLLWKWLIKVGSFIVSFFLLCVDNDYFSKRERKTNKRKVPTQIAILTCSKLAANLALQVCKLAASSAWQVCKFITRLQQVNASAKVTMMTHALSFSIATVLLQNCFASEWTLNVPIALQAFCHKFDMTNLS